MKPPRLAVPAKKSLGQHFLVDRSHLVQIAAAAELSTADTVLEIGPGTGQLTWELAAHAGAVVAVELDDRLIAPLVAAFATQPKVRIVHGDILELDPAALCRSAGSAEPSATAHAEAQSPASLSYKVVANLPYYITSAVLRHLLEAPQPPCLAVLLVQLEVAQRICAQPGDLSLLAVSVQYYAEPRLVHRVPAGAFRPVPKVDSAVLRLDVRAEPAVAVEPGLFFTVVRAGFGQKRKQLLNSLAAGLTLPKSVTSSALAAAKIAAERRAETLTLDEWGSLCAALAHHVPAVPAAAGA